MVGFLALQAKALEKKLTREREALREARRELATKAAGKMELLNAYAEIANKAKEKALAQQGRRDERSIVAGIPGKKV